MKTGEVITAAIAEFNGFVPSVLHFSELIINNPDVTYDERLCVFQENLAVFNSKLKESSADAENIYNFIADNANIEEHAEIKPDLLLKPMAVSFLKVDSKPAKAFDYLEMTYRFEAENGGNPAELLPLYPMVSASFHIRGNYPKRMFETLEIMKQHEEELCVKNPKAQALIDEFHDDSALGLGFIQAVNREYDAIKELKF